VKSAVKNKLAKSWMLNTAALAVTLLLCGVVAAGCSDQNNASAESNGTPVTDASGQIVAAAASPAKKITVAGDSISVGLGASLREAVNGDVTLKVIGEEGTGLARPDDFNWPERLRTLARDFPPEVLLLSLSSNDAQDLADENGQRVVAYSQTAQWDQEYSNRLAESFDAFKDSGTTVLWVGHVRTQKDKVGLANRRIQQLAAQVASTRPWVVVQDLATLLGTGDQVAKDCLVPDGLHLKTDCLDLAARALRDLPPIA
jgi:hypothetical protein